MKKKQQQQKMRSRPKRDRTTNFKVKPSSRNRTPFRMPSSLSLAWPCISSLHYIFTWSYLYELVISSYIYWMHKSSSFLKDISLWKWGIHNYNILYYIKRSWKQSTVKMAHNWNNNRHIYNFVIAIKIWSLDDFRFAVV